MEDIEEALTLGEPLERQLALNVRELRQERGWSQAELGRRLGALLGRPMRQTTVTKLEAGDRPIRVNELQGLAAVFGLEPADLIGKESHHAADEEDLEGAVHMLRGQIASLERQRAALHAEFDTFTERLYVIEGSLADKQRTLALVSKRLKGLSHGEHPEEA